MKILHISDLHIKNNLTKNDVVELDSIYENLFFKIGDEAPDLIVITGDLFHSKTQLSPESIDYINKIFNILNKIEIKTFVILGNHDCSLSNKDRKNGIEVILNMSKYENVQLLKEDTWTKYKDINFYVYPMDNDPKNIKQNDEGSFNICLYHGVISGAKNEFGFVFDHGLESNEFKLFDAVLLGDIHKRQSVSQKPPMYYAGSLHSLNYGDKPESGGIVWNVDDNNITTKMFNIHNNYAHVTINDSMSDDEIKDALDKYKHPKIRYIIEDNTVDTEHIASRLEEKYNYSELVFSKIKKENKEKLDKINEENYTNVAVQNELIKKYCDEIYKDELTEEQVKALVDRNNEIEDYYSQTEKNKANRVFGNVNLNKIEFENFLRYKGKNEINFEEKRGIIGILGRNAIGKSSLIDLIRFGLDGTISKNVNNYEIINYKATKCKVNTYFSVNNVDYIIERTLEKNTNKANEIIGTSSTLSFKDITNDADLTRKDINDTKTAIRNIVGTGEELENNNIMTQNNWEKITKFTDSKRKELIYKIFQLDVFEDKLAINKKLKKAIDKEYDLLTHEDHESDIIKIKNRIKELEQFKEVYEKAIKQHTKDKKEQVEKIEQIRNKIKAIDDSLVFHEEDEFLSIDEGIKRLKENIAFLETKKKTERDTKFKKDIDKIKEELDILQTEYDNQTAEIEKSNYDELEESNKKYLKAKDELLSLKAEIKSVYSLFNKQEKEYKALEENGVDMEKCKDCYAIKSIYNSYNSLKAETEELYNKYEQKEKEVKKYDVTHEVEMAKQQTEEANELKEKLQNKLLLLEKTKNEKETFEKNKEYKIKDIDHEIKETKQKIDESIYNKKQFEKENEKYKKQEESIKQNERLRKQIIKENKDLEEIDNALIRYNSDLTSTNTEINNKEEELKEKKVILQKVSDIKEIQIIAEYYNKIFHKNGLPRYIMENSIEAINITIKELLNYIVEFDVEFRIDDKDNIKIDLIDEGRRLSIGSASGMQSIISEFAIRNALINVSQTNKYNFMVIDEAFGALDEKRYSSLNAVMNFIRNNYDFTLLISHDQRTKDLVDDVIEVIDDDGISRLE